MTLTCMMCVLRAGGGVTGAGASFYGIVGVSLTPIIAGVIVLFVVSLIAVVALIVCRRRSVSSKAVAAAAVSGGLSSAGPGAPSSALLAGQRTSCGSSSVTTAPQQLVDKPRHQLLHHQYAEMRERPSGLVTHRCRLAGPSPSPPAVPLRHHLPPTAVASTNPTSYSSMSNTAASLPVTAVAVSQPVHLHYQQQQQAYQMQQQQLPHLQYYDRC